MKHFAAYYPGVYAYNDTSPRMHPWFPSYNAEFNTMYDSIVNLGEWEGEAGKPARGPAPSTGTTWRRSTFGRLIPRSTTSRSTQRTAGRSSWTSTS